MDIDPITECSQYVSCAYPNCLYYSEKITTIQSTDGIQKVWSRIRKCWS